MRDFALVLMDIEGSEYFALQGMQGILSRANALSMEFLPHHIRDVAGISIDALAAQVEPHFEWLYVPSRNALFGRQEMRQELCAMFERGEGHNDLYFLKVMPAEWRAARGLA